MSDVEQHKEAIELQLRVAIKESEGWKTKYQQKLDEEPAYVAELDRNRRLSKEILFLKGQLQATTETVNCFLTKIIEDRPGKGGNRDC